MTGRLRVAVIDSGIHRHHPHLSAVPILERSVLGDEAPFEITESAEDLNGHGTAVAAAIAWLEPRIEILAVRVLDAELRATRPALVRAFELAADEGAALINLSAGTVLAETAPKIAQACARLLERNIPMISVGDPQAYRRGLSTWPGACPGVLQAFADASLPPGSLHPLESVGNLAFRCHASPRPAGGPNFTGPSFAAACLSARVATLMLEGSEPDPAVLAAALARVPDRPPGGSTQPSS
jgi:hypothetical protein